MLALLRQDLPLDATTFTDPEVIAALAGLARAPAVMLQDALDRGDPISAEAALRSLAKLAELGGVAVLGEWGTLLSEVMPKLRAHEAKNPSQAGLGDKVLIALIEVAKNTGSPELQKMIIDAASQTGRLQVLSPGVVAQWKDVRDRLQEKAAEFKSAQEAMVFIVNLTRYADSIEDLDEATKFCSDLLSDLPKYLFHLLAIEPSPEGEADRTDLALWIWLSSSLGTRRLWSKPEYHPLASWWLARLPKERIEFKLPQGQLIARSQIPESSKRLADNVLRELLIDDLSLFPDETLVCHLLFCNCGPEGLNLYPDNLLDPSDWALMLMKTNLMGSTIKLLDRRARNGTLVVNDSLARVMLNLARTEDIVSQLAPGMAAAEQKHPGFFAKLLECLFRQRLAKHFGQDQQDHLLTLIRKMAARLPLSEAQNVVSPFLMKHVIKPDDTNWLSSLLFYADIGTAAKVICEPRQKFRREFDVTTLGQNLRLTSVEELEMLIKKVNSRKLLVWTLKGWLEANSPEVGGGPQDQESQLVEAVKKAIKKYKW